MANELANTRIPQLPPHVGTVKTGTLIPIYNPFNDLTEHVDITKLIVEHTDLPAEEISTDYKVLPFVSSSESAPVYYDSPNVMVERSGVIYKLVHTARPYGSTNFDAELAAGDWEAVSGTPTTESGDYTPSNETFIML